MMSVAPPPVSLMTSEGFATIEVELEASIDLHSAASKAALDALGLGLGIGDITDPCHRLKSTGGFLAILD